MMAEDEYLFWIGQKLECLHILLSADLHEVRKNTDIEEVVKECIVQLTTLVVRAA